MSENKIDKEMPFIAHLEELRWHLIRSVIAIFVFFVIAFLSKDFIVGSILLAPAKTNFVTYRMLCELSPTTCIDKLPFVIQSRTMTGQFTMHLALSFVLALIVAFPYTFWEIWRFVKPALYEKEQKITNGATFVVSFLFMTGILFGYYLVAPLSINFLANYQLDPSIINEFDIVSYFSTLAMLVLGCGLMFQLPVAIFFLSKIGVVTPKILSKFRKHAIVGILVVAAIMTPSTDIFTQILIAIPLTILYELSIFVSAWAGKKGA
ncbi:MAG: twin-arginine translocase subunit TatC [Bacteroidetes bacterium]|nr:MAG: twin-arginine translocase subunit TatC [Bacteroidota bacterium]